VFEYNAVKVFLLSFVAVMGGLRHLHKNKNVVNIIVLTVKRGVKNFN
jgi:hypothetical protein